jgi:hypothetical protein
VVGVPQPQTTLIDKGLPHIECIHNHRPNLARQRWRRAVREILLIQVGSKVMQER